MSSGAGLHKISGGIAKREREAWQRPCSLCGGETVALVETVLRGPQPVCVAHATQGEALGYSIRWATGKAGDANG